MKVRRTESRSRPAILMLAMVLVLGIGRWARAVDQDSDEVRTAAAQSLKDNNFNDAYLGFRQLATSAGTPADKIDSDLRNAIDCLMQLGRVDEIDALRDAAIAAQPNNWRLLQAAATSLIDGPQFGFVVAGDFSRGNKRGGGRLVNSLERDRVRALQLFVQALPEAAKDAQAATNAEFYQQFAAAVFHGRGQNEAWRLQHLTNLSVLPDFQDMQGGIGVRLGRGRRGNFGGGTRGAPVDAQGNPVFYSVPASFEIAKSDGQRWRWLLAQPEKYVAARQSEMQMIFAGFLRGQFDVVTMHPIGFGMSSDGEDRDQAATGPYAIGTLKETETIAQLATGVKRFDLPDEFNFIRIYQKIAAREKSSFAEQALDLLTQVFEDRRQYPRAAGYLREAIEKYGPGDQQRRQLHLEQIVGNWGRFENAHIQPLGQRVTVDFRFRNGRKVKFEAEEIKTQALLDDVKKYLKSSPNQLDGNQINIGNIGHRLVEQNQQQYVGEHVADWDLDLVPLPEHLDRIVTVKVPLEIAGAYLVTARMDDGNVSRIIVWLTDTAILQKQMENQTLYFVADAATGKPVPKANLEFFGWRQEIVAQGQSRILFSDFAEFTDQNGLVVPSENQLLPQYQWVAVARTDEGRFAYLGFGNVWYNHHYDVNYNQSRTYCITDRPVYQPGQTAKFKFWIRTARYDQDGNDFAHKTFKVRIVNSRGEIVEDKPFTADEYGGFDGEIAIPEEAPLGQWGISVIDQPGISGRCNFRVEEYKKPEFEVTIDQPSEPVMLGEKITAVIKAKYFFGAPVSTASVKIKVERTTSNASWYPLNRWDWLFGNGYWWFASDYPWYPGWRDWGCQRPFPVWRPNRQDPPELVLENEMPIGADGTVKIEIDTLPAKLLHGDQDHSYSITAEVVDESRRTIVGTGRVLVGRKPFNVFTWLNRGHYRVGDTIEASFKAQSLDQKPVTGKGQVVLYGITYEGGKPIEKAIQNWDLTTNERGDAQLKIEAAAAGQYRLSCTVTDAKGVAREGGYLFVITGPAFDGKDFQFNDLEIIADKSEYKSGDTLNLLINSNHSDATVLLFLRPTNGVYLPPRLLKLQGKSTTVDVAVIPKDMPNFFVEAVTIFQGKVHTEAREIAVPPEDRILNVAIMPSAAKYQPGSQAQFQIQLTDSAGKPFVGSTVVSIYDKSVEYISGQSNIVDIKKFFWSWRRRYIPSSSNNLMATFYNLLKSSERGMSDLGAFGRLADRGFGAGYGAGQRGPGPGVKGASPNAMSLGSPARVLSAAAKRDAADVIEDRDEKASDSRGSESGELVDPTVRKKFADTALWIGSLSTDKDGRATVSLEMPENLGAWKIRTWALGHGTQVGESTMEVTTTKNILVRMQAPRFFVETDEVVLSANVHNELPTNKIVTVELQILTDSLIATVPLSRDVEIAANSERRVDWRVRVVKPGAAIIRMRALTNEESDAMEMTFPVEVHGTLKTDSYTGIIKTGDDSQELTLIVPRNRRVGESRLEVRYSPTLAGALVDALPYLIDYPIKTSDTTLCKFLPTVIAQNVLKRMNVDLAAVKQHLTNLNPQEIGDSAARSKQWKRFEHNPVFDNAEVTRIVKTGIQDLTAMQLLDGGWGWLSGWGERSDPQITAQIVHGLQLAKENEVALVPGVLEKGIEWLRQYQQLQIALLKSADARDDKNPESLRIAGKANADDLDAFVFLVLVDANQMDATMRDYLYRDRGKVSVSSLGLIGLAMHKIQDQPKLKMVMQNLDQFVVQDAQNQTAYLKLPEQAWPLSWYASDIEANALYLKLLSRTDPNGPQAAGLVKYLLNNRKHATYWNSTRDTALCIEAMAEFLQAGREDNPQQTIEVWFDGLRRKEVTVDSANLFTFSNQFVLSGDALTTGPHKLELKRRGSGPLYWNAYVTNFTQEDFITRSGLEITIQRKYYKLTEKSDSALVAGAVGQAADQRILKYERQQLSNPSTVDIQDLVEVELEIDSKNDYEFLVFEDMKAAGFEPVDLRSGYRGNALGAYMEFRNDRVVFLVRRLARGKHSVSYRLRAEIPGKFSALPATGKGIYAPELRGNSDEIKLTIEDRPIGSPKRSNAAATDSRSSPSRLSREK